MTNKIKRNHFYVHSNSVRYASPAHVKNEKHKIYNSYLTGGFIETRDDTPEILILERMSLNDAYSQNISKR